MLSSITRSPFFKNLRKQPTYIQLSRSFSEPPNKTSNTKESNYHAILKFFEKPEKSGSSQNVALNFLLSNSLGPKGKWNGIICEEPNGRTSLINLSENFTSLQILSRTLKYFQEDYSTGPIFDFIWLTLLNSGEKREVNFWSPKLDSSGNSLTDTLPPDTDTTALTLRALSQLSPKVEGRTSDELEQQITADAQLNELLSHLLSFTTSVPSGKPIVKVYMVSDGTRKDRHCPVVAANVLKTTTEIMHPTRANPIQLTKSQEDVIINTLEYLTEAIREKTDPRYYSKFALMETTSELVASTNTYLACKNSILTKEIQTVLAPEITKMVQDELSNLDDTKSELNILEKAQLLIAMSNLDLAHKYQKVVKKFREDIKEEQHTDGGFPAKNEFNCGNANLGFASRPATTAACLNALSLTARIASLNETSVSTTLSNSQQQIVSKKVNELLISDPKHEKKIPLIISYITNCLPPACSNEAIRLASEFLTGFYVLNDYVKNDKGTSKDLDSNLTKMISSLEVIDKAKLTIVESDPSWNLISAIQKTSRFSTKNFQNQKRFETLKKKTEELLRGFLNENQLEIPRNTNDLKQIINIRKQTIGVEWWISLCECLTNSELGTPEEKEMTTQIIMWANDTRSTKKDTESNRQHSNSVLSYAVVHRLSEKEATQVFTKQHNRLLQSVTDKSLLGIIAGNNKVLNLHTGERYDSRTPLELNTTEVSNTFIK